LIGAAILAGCGSTAHSAAPDATQLRQDLAGSPPELAALHAQANHLLDGGKTAFDARLKALHGYPVVVNKWASWCGPCQTEFPAFQQAAAKLGKKVAFIGIDGQDSKGAASTFLKQFPVSYPSYNDPHATIAGSIQASTYFPMTIYINPKGTIVFVHAGQYISAAAVERDIRRYVLG
jgi:thiol-disulfide isomerase/thioredoxin